MHGEKCYLTLKAVTVLLCLHIRLLQGKHDITEHTEHLVYGRLLALALVIEEGERKNIGCLIDAAELFVQITDFGVINKGDRNLAGVAVLLVIECGFDCLTNQHLEAIGQGKLVLMVVKINAQIHFSVHNRPHFVFLISFFSARSLCCTAALRSASRRANSLSYFSYA